MTNLISQDEMKSCRNRVNPVKDETHLIANSTVRDDYTCTKVKAKKNELDFNKEVARLTREVWDD